MEEQWKWGKIKYFNASEHWGLISSGSQVYYFHVSDVVWRNGTDSETLFPPRKWERVKFLPVETNKQFDKASSVTRLELRFHKNHIRIVKTPSLDAPPRAEAPGNPLPFLDALHYLLEEDRRIPWSKKQLIRRIQYAPSTKTIRLHATKPFAFQQYTQHLRKKTGWTISLADNPHASKARIKELNELWENHLEPPHEAPRTGTITAFHQDKGFGYIQSGSQQYYAHIRDFDCRGSFLPKEGQEVTFRPTKTGKGLKAVDIQRMTPDKNGEPTPIQEVQPLPEELTFFGETIRIEARNFHSRIRRHTPNFRKIMRHVEDVGTTPKHIKRVLRWFLYSDRRVPLSEKRSIREIYYCPISRIIVLRMERQSETYENLSYLGRKTGWYFYITGTAIRESKISAATEDIPHKFTKADIRLSLPANPSIQLQPIASRANHNAFLLTIGTKHVLLDAGMDGEDIEQLQERVASLDLIFLSHSHYDHDAGLHALVQAFPDVPIVCSKTTQDFYVLQADRAFFDDPQTVSPPFRRVVENIVPVANGDKIPFNETSTLQFFFAGHMPGALMLFLQVDGVRFLYTGDYTFHSYPPIPGVESVVESDDAIPTPIDFLLVDGTAADRTYVAPRKQWKHLKDELKHRADHDANVLIGADPGSSAIILYLKIFRYFRDLQLQEHYENRPDIYMNYKVREFAKIINTRTADLHPSVREKIKKELNPFSSATLHWIQHASEHHRALTSSRNIILYDPPDLHDGWIQHCARVIGQDPQNLLYLAGPLRTDAARALAAGKRTVTLGGERFTNHADVLNYAHPKAVLNLHADFTQLQRLLNHLQPATLCFFHQDPSHLEQPCTTLSDTMDLKETYILSETDDPIPVKRRSKQSNP